MTVQVESRHTFMTVVSTVDDDCTCRQMIMSYHQASLSSRVRMIELEDGKAKIHLVDSSRTIFRFSMHGTCMRSMNELVVYTMLVVQPTSRVHNPMAVPSKMMGDVGIKVRKRCVSADLLRRLHSQNPAHTYTRIAVQLCSVSFLY